MGERKRERRVRVRESGEEERRRRRRERERERGKVTMALRSLRTCALELQKQLAATSFNKTTSLGGFGHQKIGAVAQVTARLYHETVIDHYENPRNVGSFDKKDKNVGTGLVGAPACGDVMKLQIKVDDDGNIIDSCFKTFGCGSVIASSSLATEWVKGRTVDEVTEIKNQDIAKHRSLLPVKLHCSMLAEDAIKAAVKDLKKKNEKQ